MNRRRPTRRGFLSASVGVAGTGAFAPLLTACRGFETELDAVDEHTARSSDAYSLDPEITYLNHGSIGTMPRIVQNARAEYLAACESNPWLHLWSGFWDDARERTRESAARLLGCDASDVAINHNTTEGFNLLAAGLQLGPGDEVVFSSLNHAGASVCWEERAKQRGFTVKKFTFSTERVHELTGDEIVALHAEHLTDRTRVLCFPHIDNQVGLRHPVAGLAAMAKSRGVGVVAVDGAQSLGMLPVDVAALGVDVYACSPHKWVQSPKGLGLLYIHPRLRPRLRPNWVTWGQSRWAGTVRIFEDYGTRNMPEVLALGDAIEFQLRRDIARGAERLRKTWDYARTRATEEPGVTWRSPVAWERSASLWAIEVDGHAAEDVFDVLWNKHGIVVRAFGGKQNWLRVSPNLVNTRADIDRLFRAIRADVLG